MDSSPYQVVASRYTADDINFLSVDREYELEVLKSKILSPNSHDNILIYGERGVGKTFLLRLLENRLKDLEYLFFIRYDILNTFFPPFSDSQLSQLPQNLLLFFISSIWCNLFHEDYHALRNKSLRKNYLLMSKSKRTLCDIYEQILQNSLKTKNQNSGDLKLGNVFKGSASNIEENNFDFTILKPYELNLYIDDIKSKVLNKLKIKKVLFVIDEANQLPIEVQSKIMNHINSIFINLNIQIIFSLSLDSKQKSHIRSNHSFFSFANIELFELKGFPDISFTKSLVDKHFPKGCFPENTYQILHDEFHGVPRPCLSVISNLLSRGLPMEESIITNREILTEILTIKEMQKNEGVYLPNKVK